jgi:MFS superfamily sulfate permease-like transporter
MHPRALYELGRYGRGEVVIYLATMITIVATDLLIGVAVGVALASGLGLSIAMAFVGARWISTYDWPLW